MVFLDMTPCSLVCILCKGATLSVETLGENNGRRRVLKLVGINFRQRIFALRINILSALFSSILSLNLKSRPSTPLVSSFVD
jgi:hypothetical protein